MSAPNNITGLSKAGPTDYAIIIDSTVDGFMLFESPRILQGISHVETPSVDDSKDAIIKNNDKV